MNRSVQRASAAAVLSQEARAIAMLLACLLLAAMLSGCRVPASATVEAREAPSATPTEQTGAPKAVITLTPDINRYSPLMSSAFGIGITAADAEGHPVEGKWSASWGQFCTAVEENGGWKISSGKPDWENASHIWWQFPLEQNLNGETPSSISIWFETNGLRQTLTLERVSSTMVKVSGTPDPTFAPIKATLKAYPSIWMPEVSSAGGIRLWAVGDGEVLLNGKWSASRGLLLLPPFRNADGSVSLPDQQPRKEIDGVAEVEWYLDGQDLEKSGAIEVRYTQGGQTTVMVLEYDSATGLVTVGERPQSFTANDLYILKEFTELIRKGRPAADLLAYTDRHIAGIGGGLGEVLADAVMNRLMDGNTEQAVAKINWAAAKAAFHGKEGSELASCIELMQLESEKPYVIDNQLAITMEELARRYVLARDYTLVYPFRPDWHHRMAQYCDSYFGALLTMNGTLFSGDGSIVPEDKRDIYSGVIAKYSNDPLGGLLEEWVALLKREGWTLTDPVREFLTAHSVPGY